MSKKEPKVPDSASLVKSAILISVEAIFCLGLIAMILSFLMYKDKNGPNMALMLGGFAAVLLSLLILSVMLCLKCANSAISKDLEKSPKLAKISDDLNQIQNVNLKNKQSKKILKLNV